MQQYSHGQIKKAIEDVEARQMEGFLFQEPGSESSRTRRGGQSGRRSRSRNRSCRSHRSNRSRSRNRSCRSHRSNRSRSRNRSCRSHRSNRSRSRNRSCRSRRSNRCRRRRRLYTEDVFDPTSQTRYWYDGNMYLLHQKK